MRNQLRMEIWNAINGVRISREMFTAAVAGLGYDKTVAVVQMLENNEYSYLFLGKNFDRNIPAEAGLTPEETVEGAMILAKAKLEILTEDYRTPVDIKNYCKALLENIRLLDLRDQMNTILSSDNPQKMEKDIRRIEDYAAKLDEAEAELALSEKMLLRNMCKYNKENYISCLEVFVLFMPYVYDAARLKRKFEKNKLIL